MSGLLRQFSKVCAEHGSRTAVAGEGVRLSYRELDEITDRIASGLRAMGVAPGDLVAVKMGRSPWFIAAAVGLLKCGAAYVPIDPTYPMERRKSILDDLRAGAGAGKAVVGIVAGGQRLPQTEECRWVGVDTLAAAARSPDPEPVGDDAAAYVMFTSGSSGRPKGVIVPHRGIERLVCEADFAHFGSEQVWALLSSVAFDASTLEIFGALLNGGCCTVVEDALPTLERIAELFASRGVTDAWLTAALFNSVVDFQPEAFSGLKQVFTGGEAESVRHFRRFRELHPDVRLIHGYGPTENTTFSLCHTVQAEDLLGEHARVPIGRVIHGSTARILDDNRLIVPRGTPGELYVGGRGVALGYLRRPELTRERFVGLEPGGGLWYRTGDLVEEREDGAVVFLGRVDRQVKLRGYRIEPEDIEKCLLACPGVTAAVVEVEGESAEERRLVACYSTSNTAAAPDDRALRAWLAEHVPSYMVPAEFRRLAAMPLNSSGKLDRAAVAELAHHGVWTTVHEVFRDAVRMHAERTAVVGETMTLTYAELDALSDRIATGLLLHGVERGDYVPLFMGRSPMYIAAVLAVLKLGAAYAPIDPEHPPERRASILADLASPLAVTTEEFKGGQFPGCQVLDVAALARAEGRPPHTPGSPEDAAYVMFTSGSTGRPKGVIVPHRGIIRLVCWKNEAEYLPGRRWGVLASVGFDLSTQELWGALLHGGACVTSEGRGLGVDEIARWIRDRDVTDLVLTQTVTNLLTDYGLEHLGGVRQIFTGGEPESIKHFRKLKAAHPRLRLVQGYGPTETTTWSHLHPVTEADLRSESRVTVGLPMDGPANQLLMNGMEDTPAGEVGEIVIGGPGVALGYLNRPELTDEKFIRLPGKTGLYYRSGDLGRVRPDGLLEIVGRADRQVKIRGYRIELEEVEKVLAACPAVTAAAVNAPEGPDGVRMLVAYCAASDGSEAEVSQAVRQWLGSRLASYMLPSRLVVLRDLPRTTNGKIDRAALRLSHEPDANGGAAAGKPPADGTGGGTQDGSGSASGELDWLSSLWRELLPGVAIRAETDFFAAGGHSVLAMRMVAEIRRRTGVAVKPSMVYTQRTLAKIAASVAASGSIAPVPTARQEAAAETEIPCTATQRGLVFEWSLDRTSPVYHVFAAFIAEPGFDPERFAVGFRRCLERHESLRVTLTVDTNGARQRIGAALAQERTVFVENANNWNGSGVIPAVLLNRIRQPFDLEAGPVVRAHVAALAEDRWFVAIVFHHSVVDEWTVNMVLEELESAEAGASLAEPGPLRRIAEQESASHGRQSAMAKGRRLAEAVKASYPKLLPLRAPAAERIAVVPSEIASAVDRVAQEIGVSPFAVYLSAFAAAVSAEFGIAAPWIATPFGNRNDSLMASVAGCAIDVRLLEFSSLAGRRFIDVLEEIHHQLLVEHDAGPTPVEWVIDGVHAAGGPSDAALQFVMTYRIDTLKQRMIAGGTASALRVPPAVTKFGLLLNVERNGDRVELVTQMSCERSDVETAQRLVNRMVTLLSKAAHTPTTPIETDAVAGTPPSLSAIADQSRDPTALLTSQRNPVPNPELRSICADLWSAALEVGLPADDADFFAQGGGSLLMMRLAAELKRVTGRSLDLAQFAREPSFGCFCSLAASARGPAPFASLGPAEAPLTVVAIPGMGGTSIAYLGLWRQLESMAAGAVRLISVDVTQPTEKLLAGTTVPAITEELAELIWRSVRGKPYVLVGHSLGGILGIEAAAGLERRGRAPMHVWLLDSFASTVIWNRNPRLQRLRARLWQARVHPGEFAGWIGSKFFRGGSSATGAAGASDHEPAAAGAFGQSSPEVRSLADAFRGHDPAAYSGPVTLLNSTVKNPSLPLRHAAPLNGFGPQLRGTTQIRTVDVAHLDFLSSGLRTVAASIWADLAPMMPPSQPTTDVPRRAEPGSTR